MKIAVIIGATSGIGKAIAKILSKHGYHLALVGRSQEKLLKMLNEAGNNGKCYMCDLSSVEQINTLVSQLLKEKEITTLINVAGIWHGKDEVYADTPFTSFSQKIILDTYGVGLIAPTLLAHGLIPKMKREASIINISGTFEKGAKGWLPYYVSKKGIEDLTKGLSEELEDKEIKVNCISPSDTNTEAYQKHFPEYVDEAVEPSVIAELALKLTKTKDTGKFYVVKKGKDVYEGYHE